MKRYELPNGQFQKLEDLHGIKGFGEDKLHDLFYSVAQTTFEVADPETEEVHKLDTVIGQVRHQNREGNLQREIRLL